MNGALQNVILLTTQLTIDDTLDEPEKVIPRISQETKILQRDLLSTSREKPLVYYRQAACYILRTKLGISFSTIAELTKRNTHSTTQNSYKRISEHLGEKSFQVQSMNYYKAQAIQLATTITLDETVTESTSVIDRVCKERKITREELLGSSESQRLVYFRQATAYILREKFAYSFPKISSLMGKKNFSIAVKSHRRMLEYMLEMTKKSED